MALKTVTAHQAINLDTPNIAMIKRELGEQSVRDILILALTEVVGFFNVGKTMDAAQVALTAELITQRYWYLRLEEIKSVFRRNMMSGKVYDRLDPNTIMVWLSDYDLERTNACEDDASNIKAQEDKADFISHKAWIAKLMEKASAGDEQAIATLRQYQENKQRMAKALSSEDMRRKEIAFRIFKYNYQKNKNT